jgi:hypothetical protein
MLDTMRYVKLYPDSKIPVGDDWASRAVTEEEMLAVQVTHPRANWGVLFGPDLMDVECDSEEATVAFAELFPDVRTPSWKSKRGRHNLFAGDARLASLPAVVKYRGVEFRLGNGKACQSVIPPSTVDGVKREWILSPKDCPPANLPESVIQALLTLPPVAKGQHHRQSTAIPAARKATVARIRRWCQRAHLSVVAEREEGELVFLDLAHCAFSPDGSDRGAPAFILFADGGFCYKCFHPEHADKGVPELEAAFGPFYPIIRCGTDLHRIKAQALAALQDEPGILQHGVLGVIAHDPPKPKLSLPSNGAPQFRPMVPAAMAVTLSGAARFQKFDKRENEWVATYPPDKVVAAIIAGPEFPGIPVLAGVVSSPILRSDGTIAFQPGYDVATGLYLDIAGTFPPVMEPSKALACLDDVLFNFPFATPAHRAAAIAAISTVPARPAFPGSAPFFLVDANASRVGKGKLTDLFTVVWERREAARHDVPKSGDGEMRKTITAVALAGSPYFLFDNIRGKFGGATLENAMTTGRWSDRLLGLNVTVDLPLNFIWLGTSNNAVLTGDIVNRTLHIRMESNEEHPERRSGFRHPDLLGYAKEHRRELVVAALSLPAGYIAAGRPDMHLAPWGGFDGWSDLIRSAVVWAGLPDPRETADELAEQADEETTALRELIDAWIELGGPSTVSDAIIKADTGEAPMLATILADLRQEDRRRALGTMLRAFRGRVLGGYKFDHTKSTSHPRWLLAQVKP